MTYFPPLERWDLPGAALEQAHREFQIDGSQGNEGIMLWLGRREIGVAVITHCVLVRGKLAIKEPDLLQLEPALLNDITIAATTRKIVLLGQIHSHPGTFVDLSDTDHRYGFKFPDFLSIVAPHYGLKRPESLFDYGVHVYDYGVGYRRLEGKEIQRRLNIVDSRVELIEVGGSGNE